VRRIALVLVLLSAAGIGGRAQRPLSPSPPRPLAPSPPGPFSIIEASIADMQSAMAAGRTTSHDIVQQSLTRIALHEERLNAALAINPRALDEAAERDRERQAGKVRGPLHGVPIALKDNIQTTNMPTTGGALAFAGFIPPYEATLTRHLRDAGAIIIAKTVMTELANWVGSGMPTNYSSLGGFGFNPYDPRRDPRASTVDGRPVLQTGGSSSGIGTAASFWAANVGTETSGSILSPASQTMLAAIKPTVGRISRHGVMPLTADQDTPGPMARTVADAAILLGVLEGRPDANDRMTTACTPPPNGDYRPFLRRDGLKGARIGIPRAYFYNPTSTPGGRSLAGGISEAQRRVMADAIAVMTAQGATIVDPADIPSVITTAAARSLIDFPPCNGAGNAKGMDDRCSIVFKYGMKRDFNDWLASLGPAAPVRTLSELRDWNTRHLSAGTLRYGQAHLDISDEMDVEADRARYLRDREKGIQLGGLDGIDAAMRTHKLDALLFPSNIGADVAARPGYPTVIVPFGLVPNAPIPALPDGFDARPSPFGISFTGSACSEPKLIELAYAFEQATKRRVPPSLP
jgi:amidase